MLVKQVSIVVDPVRNVRVECSVCHQFVAISELVPQAGQQSTAPAYICSKCYAEKN